MSKAEKHAVNVKPLSASSTGHCKAVPFALRRLISLPSRRHRIHLSLPSGGLSAYANYLAQGVVCVKPKSMESYFDIARRRIDAALARPDMFIEKPARAARTERPVGLFDTTGS